MRSSKGQSIGLLVLSSAALLIVQTITWFNVQLGAGTSLAVVGSDVVPSASALGAALLALAAALLLAGPRLRTVLAIVGVVLSVWLLFAIWAATFGGTGALVSTLSKSTGIVGDALNAEIASVQRTAASWWAFALSVVLLFGTLWVLTSHRSWNLAARRFERDQSGEADDPASNWDSLSRGNDPTESR